MKDQLGLCSLICHTHTMRGNCSASQRVLANSLRVVSAKRGNPPSVADVDPDTLIRIVRSEPKNCKAPGIDNVYNIILKKAIGTGFYNILSGGFTISLKLDFIPYVWKVGVLCMLIKPDKPPSQTTSY